MDFKKYCYFPILRTKDAELRAIENLSKEAHDNILPIYELTKSRKTKKDPIGDIAKRMEQISKIQEKLPFILDVTTDPQQTNTQTENFLLSSGGYEHWRLFLEAHATFLNIIPAIHIDQDDDNYSETSAFVSLITKIFSCMALRVPSGLDEDTYAEVLDSISPFLESCQLIIIVDNGCIRGKVKEEGLEETLDDIYDSLSIITQLTIKNDIPAHIVCVSGSFPLVPSTEGGDTYGYFKIYENNVFRELSSEFDGIGFGDYASISPVQTDIKGGGFVPRIDISRSQAFFYHRYRRDKGGYIKCAQEVLADPDYTKVNCWGDEEISLAAKGMPSGISPSFWISVRANRYMTQRASMQKR